MKKQIRFILSLSGYGFHAKEWHLKDKLYKNKVWEHCPKCENDVQLKSEFKVQKCPKCHKEIKPCSLCVLGYPEDIKIGERKLRIPEVLCFMCPIGRSEC